MSDGPLSPEEVAHRGFGTTFRGFDTAEVRAYLQRVGNELKAATARERELHKRVADAEHRAAHPVLEGDALTRVLGDEMGRILATAQAAANGLKDKAEENAARILREAHDQAQRIRAQAEAILALRTEEADAEAAEIRRVATAQAAEVVERAAYDAAGAMADVEGKARQLVLDAQAARARVLGDLTRRRRLLQIQVEQLRAGRDRLLDAYRKVRSTTDEVADELQRVEDEAREAAGAAGERVAAGPMVDDLNDVLAAFAAAPATEGGGPSPGPAATSDGDAQTTASATGPTAHTASDPASVAPGGGDAEAAAASPQGPGLSTPFPDETAIAGQPAGQGQDAAPGSAAESTAPEAVGSTPLSDAGPLPQLVSTRPGGERRPLRLLRRPKGDGRPLDVVPLPADDEAVRMIPPTPEPPLAAAATSVPAPADEQAAGEDVLAPPAAGEVETRADPPAAGESNEPAAPAIASEMGAPASDTPAPGETDADAVAGVAGVDELFARIRAGRAGAVARAHEVLTADPGAPVQLGTPAAASPGDEEASVSAAASAPDGPVEEESLLRRRDTAVEGLEAKLARKLKRALQDEQNEVLDRLRSAKAGAGPEAVLPAPADQAGRYRQAAEEALQAAAAAGMTFMAPSDPTDGHHAAPDVSPVVDELVSSLGEPLRRALERAMRGDGADPAAVGERIGAAYRECKAQRIEGLAGDAVTAAFSCGELAVMPAGAASRWVVDDDGRPCPDCDDNALAGPTPAGEAFPTGQAHPPAHAGCRCLLAPAALAAAMRGHD